MTPRASMLLALLLLPARAGTGTLKGTVTRGSSPATPVQHAVVMIDGPAPTAGDAAHAVMDQRQETFVPHVLAMPVGTTVDFPNHDPVLHNVASRSRARKFDLGMYGEGETRSVRFDTPGLVGIRCHVHPRMSAYIMVHGNALVAVTDAGGGYTIAGVPPGTWPVRVWHEDLAEKRLSVTTHQGQVDTLDIRLAPR